MSSFPIGPPGEETALWPEGYLADGKFRIEAVLGLKDGSPLYRVIHRDWGWRLTLRRLWSLADEGGTVAADWREQSGLGAWCGMEAHPLLGACFGTPAIEGGRYLAADFQAGLPLPEWLARQRARSLVQRGELAIQLAWALQLLHDRGLNYGPLRASDIFVSPEGRLVLTHPIPRTVPSSDWTGIAAIPSDVSRLAAEDLWQWGLFVAELFGLGLSALLAQKTHRQQVLLTIVGWLRGSLLEGFTTGKGDDGRTNQRFAEQLEQMYNLLFAKGLRQLQADMTVAADLLQEACEELTGEMFPYIRPRPDPLRVAGQQAWTALEERDGAGASPAIAAALWQPLAEASPPRPEAIYNLALLRFRQGEITGDALGQSLDGLPAEDKAARDPTYLCALLEAEGSNRPPRADLIEGYFADNPSPLHVQATFSESAPSMPQGITRETLAVLSGGVYRLCYHAAGDLLLVGCENGELASLSAQKGGAVAECVAHAGGVRGIAAQKDGPLIASCGGDGTVRLWNATDLTPKGELPHGGATASCVAFSADGALVAAADDTGTILVWETEGGAPRHTLRGHRGPVNTVFGLRHEGRLLSAGTDRTLRLWDLATGECLRAMQGHRNLISSLSLSEDHHFALTGGWDRELRLWDLETGECLRVLTGHRGWITSVAFSPCMNRAFSSSSNGELILWNLDSGEILEQEKDAQGCWVREVLLTPQCRTLFAAHSDGRIDATRFNARAPFRAPLVLGRPAPLEFPPAPAAALSLAEAKSALLRGDVVQTYRHLRVHRGPEERRSAPWISRGWSNLYRYLPVVDFQGVMGRASFRATQEEITALAVDPAGQHLFVGARDGRLFYWDLYAGSHKAFPIHHEDQVTSLALSTDGKLLVSGSRDATVRVWDLAAGKLKRTIPHDSEVTSVGITVSGKCTVSGSRDRYIRCWEIESGKMCYRLGGHHRTVSAVVVSPDDRLLLSAGASGFPKLWERETQSELRNLRGPLSETTVCFTPDGCKVLSGGHDNTVHLWDVESGRLEREMFGHTDRITAVTVSPDGKFAFSVAEDETLRIWSIVRGECLQVLRTPSRIANCLVVDPYWRYLAAGSKDGVLELWLIEWRLGRPRTAIPLLDDAEKRRGLFCPSIAGATFSG